MPLNIHNLSIIILLLSLLVFLHVMKKGDSPYLRSVLICMSLLSLAVYFQFFRMHALWPSKPQYIEAHGYQPRKSLVHWHEMLHYYIGAKYFNELGYGGLYEAITLADAQSANPAITLGKIKDLSHIPQMISKEEAIERAQTLYRPRFTDQRWLAFTEDIAYMKSIARLPDWLNHALFDAGYNPPPTWALLGSAAANLVPISHAWFDYGPDGEQIGLLPWFDNLMLLAGFFMIARIFGVNSFFAFFMAFGTSYLVNYEYNFGSLFRYTWFFALIISLCMLKKERYALAGAAMAVSVMDRLFPVFFAYGAIIALGWRYCRGRDAHAPDSFKPLRDFCLSLLVCSACLFILSVAVFGLHSWVEFFAKISHHALIRFTNHIGYFRIATFDSWVYHQNFWGEDGTIRFMAWNDRLNASWDEKKWLHFPLILMVILGAIACARKIPAYESALLFGTLLLFLFTVTVMYYYVFLALIPAILYKASPKREDMAIFAGFFVSLIAMRLIPLISADDLVQNFYISLFLFLFLIFWVTVRLMQAPQPANIALGMAQGKIS